MDAKFERGTAEALMSMRIFAQMMDGKTYSIAIDKRIRNSIAFDQIDHAAYARTAGISQAGNPGEKR